MTAIPHTLHAGVATIRLDGANSNAIDVSLIRSIHLTLDQVEKRSSGARAVVITGGQENYCSGVDLNFIYSGKLGTRHRAYFEMRRLLDPLIRRLSCYRFPIISAVNGAAVGAGMSLALASDIIIAGESAYFHPTFSRLGVVPDAGITFHLARRIGSGRSLASILLAEKISAQHALDWGLVYAVVSDTEVLNQAQALAQRLAAGPQIVLSQIRALHASTFSSSLQEQLRAERNSQALALDSESCVEGVKAFFEKREPHFVD